MFAEFANYTALMAAPAVKASFENEIKEAVSVLAGRSAGITPQHVSLLLEDLGSYLKVHVLISLPADTRRADVISKLDVDALTQVANARMRDNVVGIETVSISSLPIKFTATAFEEPEMIAHAITRSAPWDGGLLTTFAFAIVISSTCDRS